MPKVSDPDFYITCATVIPVLFLALTLQGGAFQKLLVTAAQVDKDGHQTFTAIFAGAAAWLIVFAGAGGELTAVSVLYHQRTYWASGVTVFWAVVILIAAVATAAVPTKRVQPWSKPRQPEASAKT